MESFLLYIDKIYNKEKEIVRNSFLDFSIDRRFTIYVDLQPIEDGIDFGTRFRLRKRDRRTTLLLVRDDNGRKVKLYFSEFDIICTLISIYDNYEFYGNYICDQMCNLVNDGGNIVKFKIEAEEFAFKGINYLREETVFLTSADYEISINDFICLLNIVFEKDRTNGNSNNAKGTILKYLLFIFLFSRRTNIECKENLKKILQDKGIYLGDELESYRDILNKSKKKVFIDISVSNNILCYNNIEES